MVQEIKIKCKDIKTRQDVSNELTERFGKDIQFVIRKSVDWALVIGVIASSITIYDKVREHIRNRKDVEEMPSN